MRKSKWMSTLALLAISGLLTSCTADGDSEDDSSNGDANERVLRTTFTETLRSLDPHSTESSLVVSTVQAGRHIFDRLVVRDGDDFVGQLATDWEVVDDTTWEFTIRDDVTFHDGSSLTAADVVASLERATEQDGGVAGLFPNIDSVVAIDDVTVEINTTSPKGDMLSSLTALMIAPADLVDEPGFGEEPVGSGPFRFVEWSEGERLVLEAYPDYWDGPPALDRLEFYEILEESSRVTALISGELDVIQAVSPDSMATIEDNPGTEVITGPAFPYYFVWFNHHQEVFQDVNVRRALWHALDLEEIVETLYPTTATVMEAPVSDVAFQSADLEPYAYDPELARELLAQAGYGDGLELDLQFIGDRGPLVRELATTLAAYWADVGVTVEPQELDEGVSDENVRNAADGAYDLRLAPHSGSQGDIASVVRLYISTEERVGHSNPDFDALVERARATVQLDEQEAIWTEVQEFLWDEAVAIWPLDLQGAFGVRENVEGFTTDPDAERPSFRDATVSN